MFGSITQEPLSLPQFWCYFWVPIYGAYIIFQKCVDNFEIEHRTYLFLVRGAVPLKATYILGADPFGTQIVTCINFIVIPPEAPPYTLGWGKFLITKFNAVLKFEVGGNQSARRNLQKKAQGLSMELYDWKTIMRNSNTLKFVLILVYL